MGGVDDDERRPKRVWVCVSGESEQGFTRQCTSKTSHIDEVKARVRKRMKIECRAEGVMKLPADQKRREREREKT